MMNLKAARIKKGLTQKQVAAYLHVPQSMISKWETGRATPDDVILTELFTLYNTLPALDEKTAVFLNELEQAGRITHSERRKLERKLQKMPPKQRTFTINYIRCSEIGLARQKRKKEKG